jgi:hypothetical protein
MVGLCRSHGECNGPAFILVVTRAQSREAGTDYPIGRAKTAVCLAYAICEGPLDVSRRSPETWRIPGREFYQY